MPTASQSSPCEANAVASSSKSSQSPSSGATPSDTSGTARRTSRSAELAELATEKPRARRNGRVIGRLRITQALQEDSPPDGSIQPTSSSSALARAAMGKALSIHLVYLAEGEIMSAMPFSPAHRVLAQPSFSKSAAMTGIPKIGGKYADVLMASFAALGSRRSNHSAVVGRGPMTGDLNSRKSVSDAVAHREIVSEALMSRATDMAFDSGLLRDDLPSAREAADFVRLALWSAAPRLAFSSPIIENDRRSLRTTPTTSPERLLGLDSMFSIFRNVPLDISDAELSSFGLTPSRIRTAAASLHGPPPEVFDSEAKLNTRFGIVLLSRSLAKLQSQGPILDPEVARAQFDDYFTQSDSYAQAVASVRDKSAGPPFLSFISILIESTVANLADRQFQVSNGAEMRGIYVKSRQRYLVFLKETLQILDLLPTTPEDNHMRALLVNALDQYPGWLQLAVQGALQHDQVRSALACPAFTWDDLRILHRQLTLSAPVFATCSRREEELATAMDILAVSLSACNFEPVKTANPSTRDELAAKLAAKALAELQT